MGLESLQPQSQFETGPSSPMPHMERMKRVRRGKRNWISTVLGLGTLAGGVATLGIGGSTAVAALSQGATGAGVAIGAGTAAVGGLATYKGVDQINKSGSRYDKKRIQDMEEALGV